jgi:hypothetical protein
LTLRHGVGLLHREHGGEARTKVLGKTRPPSSRPQPPAQSVKPGIPTYVLRLQSPRGDDIRRLRWLLKTLLRNFGLRCISIEVQR